MKPGQLPRNQPLAWRVLLAFLVSPLAASFAFACVEPLYDGLPSYADRLFRSTMLFALIGAYPPTLFLGVPAFLLLRTRVRPSLINCMVVGAAIAAIPWLLLSLASNPDYASVNGDVTVRDGVRTLRGWLEIGYICGTIAIPGAFGGACFWLIAGRPRAVSCPT